MNYDQKGNKKKLEMPGGCYECSAKKHSTKESLKWQCDNGCYWPENAWKYDEINYYLTLAYWMDAGYPVKEIEKLRPDDYMKIRVIRRLL